MSKIFFRCVGILIVLSVPMLCKILYAATPDIPQSLKVDLVVSAGGDAIEGRLYSCLKKELEKFSDLEIVSEYGDWQLKVIGARIPTRSGILQEYAFSMVVLKLVDGMGYFLQGHELIAGSPNVDSGCRRIAYNFTKRFLNKDPKGKIKLYK